MPVKLLLAIVTLTAICDTASARQNGYEFPGENLIGPDEQLQRGFVLATLCHYPYSYTALKPYLQEALISGAIQPAALIYVYGFNQTRTSVLYTTGMPVDTVNFRADYNFTFGRQSTDLPRVDKAREAAYLHRAGLADSLNATCLTYHIRLAQGL